MNKKKLFGIVFVAGLIAVAISFPLATGSSGPVFNPFPISYFPQQNRDLPLIDVKNVTQGTDWSRSSRAVSANAGDTLEFSVYYHNGVADSPENTALNTMVKAFVRGGRLNNPASSHTISASLSADNAQTVNSSAKGGDVRVNINGSPAALTFVNGSVKHYPQGSGGQTLPDSIFDSQGGGVRVGDVRGCFEFHGFVNFRLKVEGQTNPVDGTLNISKEVKNNNTGQGYADQVNAENGQSVTYQIKVSANNNSVSNVTVRDVIDSRLRVYDATLDGNTINVAQLISSGVNIGTVPVNGNRIVRFRAAVPNLPVGEHVLNNTATASASNQSVSDTAKIRVRVDGGGTGENPAPSCPLVPRANFTVVNFGESYGLISGQTKGPINTNISAGKYKVTLVSWDDHTNKPDQQQFHESYFVKASNGAFQTNAISDLPSSQDLKTETVNNNLNVSGNVNQVYVVHASNDLSNKDSIVPICAGFEKISTPPTAPSCTLNASPSSINQGQTSTLTWTSQNATSASINQGIGNVPTSGSRIVQPGQTTIYTMTVNGPGGSATCKTTVIVEGVPVLPSCTLTANPSSINQGQTSTLSWTSQNATSAFLSVAGSVPINGSYQVSPTQTTTYTLTVSGPGGSQNCQTTITVGSVGILPSCTLTANPSSINQGQTSTLSWTSQNATSASINQGIGNVPTSGSYQVSPTQTTTYTMTVTGPGGSATCQTVLQVGSTTLPSCTLFANPSSINRGQTSTLTWTSQNATSAFLSVAGNVPTSGSYQVSPTQTTTYTLTVSGPGGSQNCQTTVTVDTSTNLPTCTLQAFPSSISQGQYASLNWTSQNATTAFLSNVGNVPTSGSYQVSPSFTTTYTLTVSGPGGSQNCQTTVFVDSGILPSCTLSVSPSRISEGQSATLYWSSTNANNAYLSSVGNVPLNGSYQVSPSSDRTYTLTVSGNNGTRTCNTTLRVDDFGNENLNITKRVLNVTRNDFSYQDSVSASQGETVRFEIRFNTYGGNTQNNVVVRDFLPSGLSYINGTMRVDGSTDFSETALFSGGRNFGTLGSGQSRTITFEARVSNTFTSGTLTNRATVSSNQVSEQQDTASVSTNVLGVQFTQSKSAYNNTRGVDATTITARPGDLITYTLNHRNSGNSTLNSVTIQDDISDVLQLADLVDTGGALEVTNNIIKWSPVNIAPGATVSRTFQVRVKDNNLWPAGSDRVMVNFYGNEVRVPVGIVLGTSTPPRTGAGEWIAVAFAGLFTATYWIVRKKYGSVMDLKRQYVK